MAKRIRTVIPNEDLFDEKEMAEIKAQARNDLVKEKKDKAKKLLLAELKRDMQAEIDPTEETIDYSIELPHFNGRKGNIYSCIMIDGVQYFHGQTYTFTRKQLASVREIAQNAWRHEEVAFGSRNPNAGFQERNAAVGMGSSVSESHFRNNLMRV